MKTILIIGAGLSSSTLIRQLLEDSVANDWQVVVGDLSLALAESKLQGHPRGRALRFDVFDDAQREASIAGADLVISMLPARFHFLAAKSCVRHGRHLVTASYVSDLIRELDAEAKAKGVLLLNEIGLDPGIDHMSAMRLVDRIKAQGGQMQAFRSYTGGLVAPKHDNNPWNYKFTWNPRNVVLAGQSTARLIVNGSYKYIPYHKLFTRYDRLEVDGYGEFEVYPNRDSLTYRGVYGLDDIPTMVRGTIRRPGFCRAWNVFVQLGATDDSYTLENSETMTYREFINTFLRYDTRMSVEEKLSLALGIAQDSEIMYKLRWLGIFDRRPIGLANATPAQVLQKLLEEKWTLDKDDKDMIVMQHRFEYLLGGKARRVTSSLVVEGRDHVHTGMSITVGMPVAIASKLILNGQIKATGVQLPVAPEIYDPILDELEQHGIIFHEKEEEIAAQN